MEYKTIKIVIQKDLKVLEITLIRPDINVQMLTDLQGALDLAEKNPDIRTVVLKGNDQFFSSGMDFKEKNEAFAELYANTLKRFTTIPKTIVSICEGKVLAGGVGFVSASDIVIANSSALFSLSELIWGLLPANVLPYLIRRIGFQSSYFMTLTTLKMTAQEAKEMHLVDILSDDPQKDFIKLNKRLSGIQTHTLAKMKEYFRQMWIINEEMEKLAIKTLSELKKDPLVQKNIQNYLELGKLPWE